MNETWSKLQTSFKYAYLVMFFALLSGFFSPFILGNSFEDVIFGVAVLFVGLIGGILVYKFLSSEKDRIIYLLIGFTLIIISLGLIFQLTGRV